MNNLKKEQILNLFKKNMIIPCLFVFFILVFIFDGFTSMNWLPWIMFGVASLGMISLIFDSYKIYQGKYKG